MVGTGQITSLENNDWTKRTWDLWVGGPGKLRLVKTVEDLRELWRPESEADFREQLQHLQTLPVWKAAPGKLRVEIEFYLV